jgi:hypothetical protein
MRDRDWLRRPERAHLCFVACQRERYVTCSSKGLITCFTLAGTLSLLDVVHAGLLCNGRYAFHIESSVFL